MNIESQLLLFTIFFFPFESVPPAPAILVHHYFSFIVCRKQNTYKTNKMLRRSFFTRCATVSSSSEAAAATATATAAKTTTTTTTTSSSSSQQQQQKTPPPLNKRRKIYIDKHKDMWGLRVLMCGIFMSIYLASRYVSAQAHSEHQFVPVYNEDGDLEGFTHPALVHAADKVREKKK